MKLTEVLHTIVHEKQSGLVPLDDLSTWKWPDIEYLASMGFAPDGEYQMSLKDPDLSIYLKRGEGYTLEDRDKKEKKVFSKFSQLIDYFDNYEQKQENESYL